MRLFFAYFSALAPLALGAIYHRSDDLPDITFDFIVVGGTCLFLFITSNS